jgi:adenosylcobyric acid synthase
MRGGLIVRGTTSDVGTSILVTGLCRVLARRGVRVAPFKAQNMSLNSGVTESGHEIGRAQYLQAEAAGVEAEVAMNPILLKPTSDRDAQVVLNGRPVGSMDAAEYHGHKPALLAGVLDAQADLRSRFDVVLLEGEMMGRRLRRRAPGPPRPPGRRALGPSRPGRIIELIETSLGPVGVGA